MNDDLLKFTVFLRKLEVGAQDRGETGLAIFLSKPFQRLLKYPLLLQTLLFHTNPPTSEYKRILEMAAEVESIICSIQDKNIQKEERDKTRDILARIEGLDRVKQLAGPKPSRVLVGERMLRPGKSSDDASKTSHPPPDGTTRAVRGKAFKRLSDVLHEGGGCIGDQRDIWLVIFNDVVLRCQRTGTTSLPLGAAYSSKAISLFGLQGDPKFDTTGRRSQSTQLRNFYKFLKASDSSEWRSSSDGVIVRLRFGLLATSGNLVKEWCQWQSKICHFVIRKKVTQLIFIAWFVQGPRSTLLFSLSRKMMKTDLLLLHSTLGRPWQMLNSVVDSSLRTPYFLEAARQVVQLSPHPASARLCQMKCGQNDYRIESSTAQRRLRSGPLGPAAPFGPFLYSGETFANSRSGGQLVPLNPLLSRGRYQPGRQAVAIAL